MINNNTEIRKIHSNTEIRKIHNNTEINIKNIKKISDNMNTRENLSEKQMPQKVN